MATTRKIDTALKTFQPEAYDRTRESMRYRKISDSDFAHVMSQLGFVEGPQEGRTKEKVFVGGISRRPEVEVKVYSSVTYRKGAARDCGKDSIKIVVLDSANGGFLAKFGRINRNGRWQQTLATRLGEAVETVKGGDVKEAIDRPRCHKCDGLMTIRTRRSDGGEFLGCTGFRTIGCRGARNIDGSRNRRPGEVDVPCLECGSNMALKEGTSRAGRHYRFYGCTDFPTCRGTRNHADVQAALNGGVAPAPVMRQTNAPW